MKVILHADDFGYDKDTTWATIELLESGAISSATIMAMMPATDMALDYAASHPEKSFGVHLTYVDGITPVSSREEIPSLVDEEGNFLDSNLVRRKALKFSLSKKDIVKESVAQIRKIQEAGVRISHLDSHGHLHKFPSFLLALKEITRLTNIHKVRRVQNVFIKKPRISPTLILNRLFSKYINDNFISTDYFYMSANNMDTEWSDSILKIMDNLPQASVIEVGVHPGISDSETEGWRKAEYNDIKIFANKIKEQSKHQIITWTDI